jgi:PAS domain S-box-containing protein
MSAITGMAMAETNYSTPAVKSPNGSAPAGQTLAAFVEAIPDGLAALDRDARFTYVNEPAARFWGMQRDEMIGCTPEELFGQGDLQRELREAINSSDVREFELFDSSSDRWFSYKISPAPDAAVSVCFKDITDAARLRSIVDSTEDAILSKNLDGVIRTWNKAAERLFGYTADEVVGKPILPLIPLDRQQEENEIVARLRRGERIERFETVRLRKDGTSIDVSLTISPVKDPQGNIVGASHIASDMTQQQRTAAINNLLGAIVDSSDDAVVSKKLDSTITSWNKSAERLFGYTAEEAIGQSIMMLIPADRQSEEPDIIARLQRGERVDHFETKRQRKDGTLIDLSLTISPVHDAKGIVVGASKIARDITERKRMDDELRRANKDLEQFAFSASHDLQEPLRAIKIYSELLTARHPDIVAGEPAEFLRYLRDAATRMEALVRDLLSYTQVSTLERPIEPQDAGAAVANTVSLLAPSLTEAGGKVTVDPLPAVRVHGTHLKLLFQNLIGNAIKYRNPDRPLLVHVSAAQDAERWIFTVQDNGIGIKPEYKEQIFDLFTRLHTGEEYAGTGIGLAICQRIVERYNGRIWVESEPGEGSRFNFSFPS